MTDRADHEHAAPWDRTWFRVEPFPGCVVVSVGGEVDAHCSSQLDQALRSAMQSAACVVVDLTEVSFIDSSGIGALINARIRADEVGGSVYLVHPPTMVRKILVGTQLQQSFMVCDSLDEALGRVSRARE
jgi:anti-sigma B factor antagonist